MTFYVASTLLNGLLCGALFVLLQKSRRQLRAAKAAKQPTTNPAEWRDDQLRRDVQRLGCEIGTETINVLALMIAMAETTRAARLGVERTSAEVNFARLVGMANRARGNRRKMSSADLQQLIEAVVRYCAERLDAFPLEVPHGS